MKRLLLAGVAALALSGALPQRVLAQATPMGAIYDGTGCETSPQVAAGQARPVYQDGAGNLCTTATLTGTVTVGAITIANGADTAQGSTTDSACSTDNGTCTLIALAKRVNQRLTTILAGPIPISAAALPLPTGAATAALQTTGNSTLSTSNGYLATLAGTVSSSNVNIVCTSGCSGGGGSDFGSAFPSAGTAVGFSDGTDMQPGLVDGSGYLEVNVKAGSLGGIAQGATIVDQLGSLSFGSVTTTAPTYTTAKVDALSLNTAGGLRVDGSGVTQPVSGTFYQATQPVSVSALPLPTGAATSALQTTGNGYLSTLAGAVSGGAYQTAITSGGPSNYALETGGNLAGVLAAVQAPIPAQSSNDVLIGAVQVAGNSYTHITTATTTTIKSSAGVLHTVCVNTLGTVASSVTVDDKASAGTPTIAVINSLALLGCQTFDVAFATGLTIVTTGTVAPDVTVSWR